jgi:hypothetical protein
MTVYEFEHPTVSESETWRKVSNSNPWTHRVRPNLRLDEGSPAILERIYPAA